MSVLFLLTSPPPSVEGTDAVFQEVTAVQAAVGGETYNLCPRKLPGMPFPPQLFGFHLLPKLWRAERRCRVTHVYYSVPYLFPVLRLLRNPVVYTVAAGLADRNEPKHIAGLKMLSRIVVSNDRDADMLKSWGLSNVTIVPPGIDTSKLTKSTLDLGEKMTLMMASAPWLEEQFDTKGIDAMLEATARNKSIKLILLWRGLLLDELRARIHKLGIDGRVEVVTGRANRGALFVES